MRWDAIEGWFEWRTGQEEAARHFGDGGVFVEVGVYLGRSLCSLGEVTLQSGRRFQVIGVDTCRGSGPEGPSLKDYHGAAVAEGGGTFAGSLHRNILRCGLGDVVSVLISDSANAASLFADRSIDWVHLDARHDFQGVQDDIAAWMPKVKVSGWLSGDDYDIQKWPDVVRGVQAMLPDAMPWSTRQWRWVVR